MTAIESYYAAIERGDLPAAVPVMARDGSAHGVATVAVPVTGLALRMATSADWRERAAAAVLAISASIRNIEDRYINLTASGG